MKSHLKVLLASFLAVGSTMGAAGMAGAAEPTSEIRESTDPGKVAEVESRAREMQARQSLGVTDMSSGSSDNAGSSASGAPERKRHAKGKKHHDKHGGNRSGGDTNTGSNSK